jgi:hypothetical protein
LHEVSKRLKINWDNELEFLKYLALLNYFSSNSLKDKSKIKEGVD